MEKRNLTKEKIAIICTVVMLVLAFIIMACNITNVVRNGNLFGSKYYYYGTGSGDSAGPIVSKFTVTSTTNTIDVNLGVTDAGSGLDKVKITLYKIGANADGTDKLIKSYEGTAYSFTGLTSNTEYRVVLEAWDKAGNLTQDSKEISTKVENFTITYDANGGDLGNVPATQIGSGETVITTEVPTYSGYTFKGWSTNQSETNTSNYIQAGGTYNLTGDVTLYAQWKDETAPTVSISVNGTKVANGKTIQLYEVATVLFDGSDINNSDYKVTIKKDSLIYKNYNNTSIKYENLGLITETLNDVGTYEIKAVMSDTYGNTTTVTINVIIKGVASIGTMQFITLEEAINECTDNAQTTITLLENIELDATLEIPAEKNIVLDLNGKTITNTDSTIIVNNGNSVIKNGTILGGDNDAIIKTTGDLTVTGCNLGLDENVTYTGTTGIKAESGAEVTISGSTITLSETAIVVSQGANVTLENSEIISEDVAAIVNYGDMIIKEGATVRGSYQVSYAGTRAIYNYGNLTIGTNDGSVSTETPYISSSFSQTETSYGIENSGTLNWYDGKIYSYVDPIAGNGIVNLPAGYVINIGESDIDNFETSTLIREMPTLHTDPQAINSLPTSESEASWIKKTTYRIYLGNTESGFSYEYTLNNGSTWNMCSYFDTVYDNVFYIDLTTQGINKIKVRELGSGASASSLTEYICKLDGRKPVIGVSQNSATGVEQVKPTITVTDIGSGLVTNTIEYVFSTSETAPTSGYETATLSNGQVTVTSPEGANGTYYLYIKSISDNAGNTSDAYKSGAYVLKEEVTILGELVVGGLELSADGTYYTTTFAEEFGVYVKTTGISKGETIEVEVIDSLTGAGWYYGNVCYYKGTITIDEMGEGYFTSFDDMIGDLYLRTYLIYDGVRYEIGKPIRVYLEDAVAMTNGKQYDTIEKAIAACEDDTKSTVTLLQDIELDSTLEIPEGKNVSLNLNGKTINNNSGDAISNAGTLEVITSNGGKINSATGNGILNWAASTLTVKNGTISGKDGILNRGGTLTIENGTVAGTENGIENSNGGAVTINGGTITGSSLSGLKIAGGKSTIVNGGTITGANNGVTMSGHIDTTLTINGGSISGETYGIYAIDGIINFNGGEIKGKTATHYYNEDNCSLVVKEGYEISTTSANGYNVATLVVKVDELPTLHYENNTSGSNLLPTSESEASWIKATSKIIYLDKVVDSKTYEYTLDNGVTWNTCSKSVYEYYYTNHYITLTNQGVNKIKVREAGSDVNVDSLTEYVCKLDGTAPVISVSQNSASWVEQVKPTITVTDVGSGLVTNTIEYVFSKSETAPTSGYEQAVLSNGQVTLTSPADAKGTYYLYIKAVSDNAGNIKGAYKSGKYELNCEVYMGSKAYGLQEAIDACADNTKTTITVMKNIELDEVVEIPAGKNISLNLNDKTINNSNCDAISNEGTLEVTDTNAGKINSATGNGILNVGTLTVKRGIISGKDGIYNRGGTLTIKNGTITGTEDGITNSNGGTVTISGGTITGSSYYGLCITAGTTTVINGGTVAGGYNGVSMSGASTNTTLTINGGSISGERYGIYAIGGTVNFNGGEIKGKTATHYCDENNCSLVVKEGYKIKTSSADGYYVATLAEKIEPTINSVKISNKKISSMNSSFDILVNVTNLTDEMEILLDVYDVEDAYASENMWDVTLTNNTTKTISGMYEGKTYDVLVRVVEDGEELARSENIVAFSTSVYTITYDVNGGQGGPSIYEGNGDITISTDVPTKIGYTFKGWSETKDDQDGDYIQAGATYSLTKNVTLYAVWVDDIAPSVSISVNNEKIENGKTVKVLGRTRIGFDGWDENNYVDSYTYTIKKDGVVVKNETVHSTESLPTYEELTEVGIYEITATMPDLYNNRTTVTISVELIRPTLHTGLDTESSLATTASAAKWSSNDTIYLHDVSVSKSYEYTLDNGVTWSACEVLEHRGDTYYYITLTKEGLNQIRVRETGIASQNYYYGSNDVTDAGYSNTYYYKLDKSAPVISVSPNSISKAEQVKPTITVTDSLSGLAANATIEYVFSTSATAPTSGYQTATLSNGKVTLTSPEDVNGTYYLYIRGVSDSLGNTRTYKSGAYVLEQIYTITYDANGGSLGFVPSSQNGNGQVTISTEIPTQDGYTFAGWSTIPNDVDEEYYIIPGDTYTLTKDVTLYAQWVDDKDPRVTVKVNGTQVKDGENIEVYEKATVEFDGWDVNNKENGYTYSITKDGQTIANQTIRFVESLPVNEVLTEVGTYEITASMTDTWNNTTTIKSTIVLKKKIEVNYDWSVWYAGDDDYTLNAPLDNEMYVGDYFEGGVTAAFPDGVEYQWVFSDRYEDVISVSNITGDPVVNSQDIGIELIGEGEVTFGIKLLTEGYEISNPEDAMITIKVLPQPTYTITYDANGGQGGPGRQGGNGEITITSETPTRSGYTFVGWSTIQNDIDKVDLVEPGDTYTLTKNVILYAQWVDDIVPEVTLKVNNTEVRNGETVKAYKGVKVLFDGMDINNDDYLYTIKKDGTVYNDKNNVSILYENLGFTEEILTEVGTYEITAIMTDTWDNITSVTIKVIVEEIPVPTISEVSWEKGTNGVEAYVQITTDTNYQLQYASTKEGPWTNIKSGAWVGTTEGFAVQEFVYARVTDGTNSSEVVSKQLTENVKPVITSVKQTGMTTTTATLEVVASDEHSGITDIIIEDPATDFKYTYTWKEVKENTFEVEITGLKPYGVYYITVTAKDLCDNYSDAKDAGYAETALIKVTGVSLDETTLEMNVGDIKTLVAKVLPEDASNKVVRWENNNTKVVSVDQNGNVTAIAPGEATITVTTDDEGHTATCKVTVKEDEPDDPTVPVAGVSLNKTSLTMEINDTQNLTATVSPLNATNKEVKWTSANKNIATVDQNGTVRAVAAGETTITVTTIEGGHKATCKVTVKEPHVPVTGVSVSPKTLELEVGATDTLIAKVTPDNATNQNITWSSNDKTVATVKNGVVTAVGEGTAVITVTTDEGGKIATCTVTVTKPEEPTPTVAVTGVSVSPKTLELEIGGTDTLIAKVTPDSATNQNITWSSNDETVATVKNGVVTAVGEGTAVITVTTENGGYTATCSVIVTKPVEPTPPEPDTKTPLEEVTLDTESMEMTEGDKKAINVTLTPANASVANITWTSSNRSVATVDQNGVVTAVSDGTAVITVTITDKDGNVKTAKTTVTVKKATSNPGTSGGNSNNSSNAQQSDKTTATTVIPQTGISSIVLVAMIVISINAIVMFIRYRRIK